MKTALNHMTVPGMGYLEFLDTASDLGCIGVEVRNDLARPLFDGLSPDEAGERARARGLRLLGVSQVYPFNDWSDEVAANVKQLIAVAKASGAETISLIPRNDGRGGGNGERQGNLRLAMVSIKPMLEEAGITGLIEPLGFSRSSLRAKEEVIDMIEALNAAAQFKIVHDTFHHELAGGGPVFPDHTGIVHISAVTDPKLSTEEMEDEHRVLVDEEDRLGNMEQIAALLAGGYDGAFSYECFSPQVHVLKAPAAEIGRSFDFIRKRLGS